MPRKFPKIFYFLVCFLLIFEQSGFAQVAGELNIAGHLSALHNALTVEKFRPLHLRYLSYDSLNNNFKLLLDKGDFIKGLSPQGIVPDKELRDETKTLLNFFFIGISLPNDSFWVNLRPDSPDNIIDSYLAQTDAGKILLEADLQLKKDTANFTSPRTPEGKEYWNKLYQKAGELFGSENITIPTLTRPWIVPNEIIIRESTDNAYIYKATLKVMLEQDYLKDSTTYNFADARLKQLNEYSSQLIRETIIPKLTKDVNTAKRYAPLRQVYYSLILAQWFKQKFYGQGGMYSRLIDKRNLTGLTSKEDWSKTTYFQAYQKSFQAGEYNIKEQVYSLGAQTIRNYMSGGIALGEISKTIARSAITSSKPMPRADYLLGVSTLNAGQDKPFEVAISSAPFAAGSASSPAEGKTTSAPNASSAVSSFVDKVNKELLENPQYPMRIVEISNFEYGLRDPNAEGLGLHGTDLTKLTNILEKGLGVDQEAKAVFLGINQKGEPFTRNEAYLSFGNVDSPGKVILFFDVTNVPALSKWDSGKRIAVDIERINKETAIGIIANIEDKEEIKNIVGSRRVPIYFFEPRFPRLKGLSSAELHDIIGKVDKIEQENYDLSLKVGSTKEQKRIEEERRERMRALLEQMSPEQLDEFRKDRFAEETASSAVNLLEQSFNAQNRRVIQFEINPFSPAAVDGTLKNQLLEAANSGRVIKLSLNKLSSGADKFNQAMSVFNLLETILSEELFTKLNVTPYDLKNAVRELLMNAFWHGNKLDFSLPIYLYFDFVNQKIEIYDLAVLPSQAWELAKVEAEKAGIGGKGSGLASLKQLGWSYILGPVKALNSDRQIGNKAVAYGSPKGGASSAIGQIDDVFNKYGGKIIHLDALVEEIGLSQEEVVARINWINRNDDHPLSIRPAGSGNMHIFLKRLVEPAPAASSPVTDKGGIDFRALPAVVRPMPIFRGQSPSGTVPVMSLAELNNEWLQIENMLNAGIAPSSDRIKGYLQSCCSKQDFNQDVDKVLSCIAGILRLEEEWGVSTDLSLKEILMLLESDKPDNELRIALARGVLL